VSGGCIGWSGFELGNCADNTDKGVLMSVNLNRCPHPVGRPDVVYLNGSCMCSFLLPTKSCCRILSSFFYSYNYYFSCEKHHPEKFPRVLGHLISFNNKASPTSWPCQEIRSCTSTDSVHTLNTKKTSVSI
jgi:hypothetical protein